MPRGTYEHKGKNGHAFLDGKIFIMTLPNKFSAWHLYVQSISSDEIYSSFDLLLFPFYFQNLILFCSLKFKNREVALEIVQSAIRSIGVSYWRPPVPKKDQKCITVHVGRFMIIKLV